MQGAAVGVSSGDCSQPTVPYSPSVDSRSEGDWMDLCLHTFAGLKFYVDDTAKVQGSLGLCRDEEEFVAFLSCW